MAYEIAFRITAAMANRAAIITAMVRTAAVSSGFRARSPRKSNRFRFRKIMWMRRNG